MVKEKTKVLIQCSLKPAGVSIVFWVGKGSGCESTFPMTSSFQKSVPFFYSARFLWRLYLNAVFLVKPKRTHPAISEGLFKSWNLWKTKKNWLILKWLNALKHAKEKVVNDCECFLDIKVYSESHFNAMLSFLPL